MSVQLLSRASAALVALSLASSSIAQQTVAAPGQPSKQNAPLGQFEIVGDSVASAQQIFLGTPNTVFVVDKVEANPTQINGHPAWAAGYSLDSNKARPMDIVTNSFCAGGNVLGNGTWLNVGGNQAVKQGGVTADSQTGGGIYDDPDGGQSMRLLNPCDGDNCNWFLTEDMSGRRWYPTVETLEDGRAIIVGGCNWGGYVNDAAQNNPTYEFFPAQPGDQPITSQFFQNTLPANLYPLIWLLPSGKLFVQATWSTMLLDYHTHQEFALPDMTKAVRTYPASAGTMIMPLTPANNWTATIMFCGGSNIKANQFVTNWNIAAFTASTSCVTIQPDLPNPTYVDDDDLPEPRTMGNLIMLPDFRIVCLNGAGTGTAGYGYDAWAIGQSYADNPVLDPIIYDPSAPAGKKWSRDGLSPSTIPRMYHSVATLLPDGSLFVSGSNPNADYNTTVKYKTEYRVERFYPDYYNKRRPEPQGILSTLGYGGDYFNITLTKDDFFGDSSNAQKTTVVVMRTGFSTHTMNMGQRLVQLENTYTVNSDGSATLHVSQLPPNPAIFVPGPAYVFVVVDGVPSIGVQVMVGSGQIEKQNVRTVSPLPSNTTASASGNGSNGNSTTTDKQNQASSAIKDVVFSGMMVLAGAAWSLIFNL
ncbi:Copper radical oxidase [Abortiporus biennis]